MRATVLAALVFCGILSLSQAASGATPNASARTALNKIIPAVNFQNVTVRDALDFLRDVSNVNIHVNWKAIDGAGVNADTPVNMKLRNVTLRKVLNLLLTEAAGGAALTWYLEEGVIEVTTRELADSQMFTIVYDVEDLLIVPPQMMPNMTMMMGGGMNGGSSGMSGGRSGGSSRGGGGYGGGGYGGGGMMGGGMSGMGGMGGMMGGMGGMMGGMGGMMGGGYGNSGGGAGGKNARGGIGGQQKQQVEQELVDLIRETIQPDVWAPPTTTAGGGTKAPAKAAAAGEEDTKKAHLSFFNGKLVVTAPRSVHEDLAGAAD